MTLYIPSRSRVARKARGWPSNPLEKPKIPAVIDWGKKYPGLTLLSAPFVNTGKQDKATGNLPKTDVANTIKVDPAAGGQYLSFPDTSGQGVQYDILSRSLSSGDYISFVIRIRLPSSPSTCSILDLGFSASARYTFYCIASDVYIFDPTGFNFYAGGSSALNAINDGNWHVVCGKFQVNGSGSSHRLWIDGVAYANNETRTSGTYTIDTITIGNNYGLNYQDEVDISDAYVFAGEITQEVVNQITSDFYWLYKPANNSPFMLQLGEPPVVEIPTLSNIAATSVTASSVIPQIDVTFP